MGCFPTYGRPARELAHSLCIAFFLSIETVINAWRPFLVNNDPTVAALQMTHFQFDHQRFQSKRAYLDLMDVVKMDGLLVSLHALADYLNAHSNLSSSATTIYQSLKTVHKVLQK